MNTKSTTRERITGCSFNITIGAQHEGSLLSVRDNHGTELGSVVITGEIERQTILLLTGLALETLR